MDNHEEKNLKKIDKKKILIIILISIAFILLSSGLYIYYSFKNNSYMGGDFNNGKQDGNIDGYKEIEGISNLLLLGSDARSLEENSRTDAILILSMDNINKKLKLISIMRDTYVKIPGHGEQKINHAYAIGGVDLLRETIQENFEIKLDKYAVINFKGFEKLVDVIGGIEVNVTKEEMDEINKFIKEVNPKNPHLIKSPGFQRLDGQQTLSYVRIRKVGNGDYERTKRQREAVSLLMDEIKDLNVLKYPIIASKLFPYFKTNMEINTILNYAYTVYKINNFTPEQIQIPITEISRPEMLKNKGWVLLMDREQNTEIIHNFIFKDVRYDVKTLDYISFNRALEGYKEQVSTNEPERLQHEDSESNEKYYYDKIIENNNENNDNKNDDSSDSKENIDNVKDQELEDKKNNLENGDMLEDEKKDDLEDYKENSLQDESINNQNTNDESKIKMSDEKEYKEEVIINSEKATEENEKIKE